MAKTYASIQRQIEKLQRAAEALKKKEVGAVIDRIKAAIEHYGISEAELFGASGARRRRGQVARTRGAASTGKADKQRPQGKRRTLAPKYRDETGNTWAGRGHQPRWLVEAIKSGKKLEDFAV
jgi:DNA-binding protein H-NS